MCLLVASREPKKKYANRIGFRGNAESPAGRLPDSLLSLCGWSLFVFQGPQPSITGLAIAEKFEVSIGFRWHFVVGD